MTSPARADDPGPPPQEPATGSRPQNGYEFWDGILSDKEKTTNLCKIIHAITAGIAVVLLALAFLAYMIVYKAPLGVKVAVSIGAPLAGTAATILLGRRKHEKRTPARKEVTHRRPAGGGPSSATGNDRGRPAPDLPATQPPPPENQ